MSCSGVSGEAVLLDNYKLYPTGVATDFELYGAELGMPVADLDQPQSQDTAYRLSWMNATEQIKTYSVVAAFYNGDKLASEVVVKQITMAPNTEGIETGVVTLGENGSSVRVYLRDDSPKTGADDGNGSGVDITVIILIAVAAIVVVAAALTLALLPKKKVKKKKAKK